MLILLPPSETKQIGGSNLTISQVHLSYGQLNDARDLVLARLIEVSKDQSLGKKVLKLSDHQLGDLERNVAIPQAATMPAYERYRGTLYKAINTQDFTGKEIETVRKHLLIQSSLFGLISATDRIPWYRLSADTRLPDLDLRKLWQEHQPLAWARLVDSPIIDFRSRSYVELAPIPESIESYYVEVVADENGKRRALNHFNKKAKGDLVGAFLRADKTPTTIAELAKIAKSVGLVLEQEGQRLILVTTETLG